MSKKAQPAVAKGADDAVILEALESHTPHVSFAAIAQALKAIWALKRWASAARHKTGSNKRGGKKGTSSSSSVTLAQRLRFLGLRMITIAGDGNCQFRSVSQQLFGTESHHSFVRQQAVEYIESHSKQFSCFCVDGLEFRRYVKTMSRDRMWGDELTLRAICDAFGATIHVVTSQESAWYLKYTPEKPKTDKQIFLAYISPVHYNAFGKAPKTTGTTGCIAPKRPAPPSTDQPPGERRVSRRRACDP